LANEPRQAAKASGSSLSSYVAAAAEHRLKLDAATAAPRVEAEHGPITDKEREATQRQWLAWSP
jgi:hypothetical protein